MPSLKDIARICGVSVTTVSKALRNYSDISMETKEKIRQVAEELEYGEFRKQKTEETRIRKSLTYNIGLIIGEQIHNPCLRYRIIEEIELFRQLIGEKGADITIINNLLSPERRPTVQAEAVHRRVDGIACFGIENPFHEELHQLAHGALPAVSIGTFIEGMQSVVFDYHGGLKKLLINAGGLGCRNIVCIRRERKNSPCRKLLISNEPDMQVHVESVRAETPQEALISFYSLEKTCHPDGIILPDMEMYEACREALETGCRLPFSPPAHSSAKCPMPIFLSALYRFPNQYVPRAAHSGANIRAAILYDERTLIEEAVESLAGQIVSPFWEIERKKVEGRIISGGSREAAL